VFLAVPVGTGEYFFGKFGVVDGLGSTGTGANGEMSLGVTEGSGLRRSSAFTKWAAVDRMSWAESLRTVGGDGLDAKRRLGG
jgi:hypothetical protein